MADAATENRELADVAVTPPVTPAGPASVAAESLPAKDQLAADKTARSERLGICMVVGALWIFLFLHAWLARRAGGSIELHRLPERQFEFRLDVNSANAIEFQHLPGIGPKLAERIVDDRQRNGRFDSIEDLRRVKGIGVKTLEAMRPYLKGPVAAGD